MSSAAHVDACIPLTTVKQWSTQTVLHMQNGLHAFEITRVLSDASSAKLGQLAAMSVHAIFREAERKRIERTNPNPKMPLVRFVGDTWRTGGVLALSRAFGDAYLKVIRAVSIWCPTSKSHQLNNTSGWRM